MAAIVLFRLSLVLAMVDLATTASSAAAGQEGRLVSIGGLSYYTREQTHQCAPEVRGHAEPLANRLTLTISTDATSYYVGQPIQVQMVLRNEGDEPIRGNFSLDLYCAYFRTYYRRIPEAFRELLRLDPHQILQPDGTYAHLPVDIGVTAKTLKGGGELTRQMTLAFDPTTGRPALDEPGEYEFRVVYQDIEGDPNTVLTSDSLRVKVEAPSGREEDALNAYSKGELAALAQYDPSAPELPRTVTARARRFLEDYSDSVYAGHVRNGLFLALQVRVNNNRASPDEIALFNTLFAQRPDSTTKRP
jgi:hypothetical protein